MRRPYPLWPMVTLLAGAVGASCVSHSAQKDRKKPMGALPSAVTSAVPEWLPQRVMGGVAIDDDARERHLYDLRRITEGWDVREVRWRGAGHALVVVALRPGEGEPGLYALDAESGISTKISRPGDAVRSVALTGPADDRKVVYATQAPGLVEVAADGKARTIDLGALAIDGVSGDGADGFLVVAKDGANAKMFALPKGAGTPRPLVDDVAPMTPAISPDRAYVAFGKKARAGGAETLGFASVEGRGAGELATFAGYVLRNVAFHPSGRWIFFAADRDRAAFEVYALALPETLGAAIPSAGAAPGRIERVTFAQADTPSFSPDGKSIAFSSTRRGPTRDLYVARFVEDP